MSFGGAGIPVLMYHSVAPGEVVGPETLEGHLRVLASSGLKSLRAGELATAQRGFLITFDDGYADLWTHGLPLLQKYKMRAVVFALPALAGEGEPRPQGVRPYEKDSREALAEMALVPQPHPAFLRWSELTALEATGLLEVQSHSSSHRMAWSSEEIVRFNVGPPKRVHWSLPQANEGDTRPGVPIYRRRSVLATRIYFDDPGLRDVLVEAFQRLGGEGYLRERGVKATEKELHATARRYRSSRPSAGRWETEAERERRTVEDLARARAMLEERLGGSRDELCLPWGHFDRVTIECARKVGIRRVYTTRHGTNTAGKVGLLVRRFGPRRGDGESWLRSRLWIYRSTLRGAIYSLFRRE